MSNEQTYSADEPLRRKRKRKHKKSSKRRFQIFLIRYAAILLGIVIVGLLIFRSYISKFEKSRPENAMDAYISDMSGLKWENMFVDYYSKVVTPFEDPQDLGELVYSGAINGSNFSYRKNLSEYSNERPAFTVRAGSSDICKVYLAKDKTIGFGFNTWKIDSSKVISLISPRTIKITAPSDYQIMINGKNVGLIYESEAIMYDNVSWLESQYDVVPHTSVYTVDNVFGNVTIEAVTPNGNKVDPSYAAEDEAVFESGKTKYSLDITLPETYSVKVNGMSLKKQDAASYVDYYGILEGLERFAKVDYSYVNYKADGLYIEPQVEFYDESGNKCDVELKNGKGVCFKKPSDDLKDKYTDLAVEFTKAWISFSSVETGSLYGGYYNLCNYLVNGTPTYERIADSLNAMYWVSKTEVTYKCVMADNFVSHSDSCFSCSVSFSIDQKTQYEVREMESRYDLVFVNQNGRWLVASMVLK